MLGAHADALTRVDALTVMAALPVREDLSASRLRDPEVVKATDRPHTVARTPNEFGAKQREPRRAAASLPAPASFTRPRMRTRRRA
jgi:hypothetical protein